jgi:transcriptional regulator with XRE-family HTH domain
MDLFENLGKALRWLRDCQGKKQYEVAESAGITKGMLCAYETGKQRPSLETLDKILRALGSDLLALHEALALVKGRYSGVSSAARAAVAEPPAATTSSDAYPLQPAGGSTVSDLPRDTAGEVLRGFHKLVRQLQEVLQQLPAPTESEPPASSSRRR